MEDLPVQKKHTCQGVLALSCTHCGVQRAHLVVGHAPDEGAGHAIQVSIGHVQLEPLVTRPGDDDELGGGGGAI